jgi:DNA-binding transcriptional MerR regulator
MFKIGEFSKLSQVPVKTLRYYDEIGLLTPAEVDRWTGYRYYSADQLPRLNRILALKDLGLSLAQIGWLLDEELSPEELRGMLRLKRAELQQQLAQEQARLARVEARLRHIEQEGKMPTHDIVVKRVEPQQVASLRGVIPTYDAQGPLWGELVAFLEQHGVKSVGPCLTIYHDPEYREHDVEVEVCELVGRSLPEHPRIRVYELPAVETMASVVHEGSYAGFSETYAVLLGWIEANGYRIVGPNREIYVRAAEHTDDPDEFVTEIQFPVVKV